MATAARKSASAARKTTAAKPDTSSNGQAPSVDELLASLPAATIRELAKRHRESAKEDKNLHKALMQPMLEKLQSALGDPRPMGTGGKMGYRVSARCVSKVDGGTYRVSIVAEDVATIPAREAKSE